MGELAIGIGGGGTGAGTQSTARAGLGLSMLAELGSNVGVGTTTPNAPLEVAGNSPGTVGGFPSGALQVRSLSADVNGNAVITGHNANGGNKQLWYIGSTSSSNDNIGIINRQNAALSLHTNNIQRLTIDPGGSVGIGNTSPNSASLLDLQSTVKGFLLPRMTTAQRDAISSPPKGLVIYNTTTNLVNFYNDTTWGAV